MHRLQVLPSNIANMIAAGEVVQRPSSAVKELMENAVDAGATRIDVIVKDAGRTLLQVIDNGCGMSPADAVLCFERHATSKIANAEDLESILTYGFRGEALASIAAVSEVTLKTRRPGDDTATKVSIEPFNTVRTSSVSAPVGSNFEIRNLFYNTPARRKFLKSDNVELKHIIEEFTRVAITRPDIGFTLVNGERDIYSLKPAKSLKFRILDLLGSTVAGDIVDTCAKTPLLEINGFLGRPDTARKLSGNQFFFVNGRFFKSAYLHKAVMNAYAELLPEGLIPSYFLFLTIDPHTVDVNIHPAKTEIKFEDESLIFQTVYACVKETLGRNSFGGSIDFDTEGSVELPGISRSFEEYRGTVNQPSAAFDTEYNPFETGREDRSVSEGYLSSGKSYNGYHSGSQDYSALFDSSVQSVGEENRPVVVIQGKYIICPCQSGAMFVNVRRARERIIYERSLSALEKDGHVSQKALFPVQVQIGASQLPVIEDNMALLQSLGFDITPFGSDTVAVSGVPEGYSCESGKVEAMVEDLLLILSDSAKVSLPEMMRQRMAEKFASLGSFNAEPLTSLTQARGLLDSLFGCGNTDLTPGGKRIVSIVPIEELEAFFK